MGVRRQKPRLPVQDSEPADTPAAPEQPAETPVEAPEEEKKVSNPPTSLGRKRTSK